MKLCRFQINGSRTPAAQLGVFDGNVIRDVTSLAGKLPDLRWPLAPGDQLMTHWERLRPAIEALLPGADTFPLSAVALLSPIANPSKIICGVGNYPEHVAATGKQPNEHGLFFKAGSSLVGPAHGVDLSFPDRITVHETELAIVIGKPGFRIARKDALTHVVGYTIGLDMTLRGPEAFSYLKSPNTYSVVGPWLVTADEIADPNQLQIQMHVNGELRQNENTRRMVFDVARLIEFASEIMTLYPGDIIMTGNPAGATRVFAGDSMHASISGIGEMTVAVR